MSEKPMFGEFEEMLNLDGKLIAFEFTMLDAKEVVIDSNVDKEPMVFQSGVGDMMPAVENALLEMQVGESRRIVVPPEEAYGPVTVEGFKDFPIDSVPEEVRQIGRKVMSRAPDGEERMVDVVGVTDDTITLDFNHPLAGMTLFFDLKVISSDSLR